MNKSSFYPRLKKKKITHFSCLLLDIRSRSHIFGVWPKNGPHHWFDISHLTYVQRGQYLCYVRLARLRGQDPEAVVVQSAQLPPDPALFLTGLPPIPPPVRPDLTLYGTEFDF